MLMFTATWLIYRTHLVSSLRSLRFWICAVLCLAPPLIALVGGGRRDALELVGGIGTMLLLQVVAPLVGLVAGSAVVTEEVESRTITYVFTRPVARAALFLCRWLSTVTVVGLLLVTSAASLTWVASEQPVQLRGPRNSWQLEVQRTQGWRSSEKSSRNWARYRTATGDEEFVHVGNLSEGEILELPADNRGRPRRVVGMGPKPVDLELPASLLPRLAWAALLGGAFYSLVTAGLGIFLKRPVILGLGYAFAMEGVLANIPGSTQALSVQYYLRSILVDPSVSFWSSFEVTERSEFLTWLPSSLRLGILILLCLSFCAWAIGRRQFVLSS